MQAALNGDDLHADNLSSSRDRATSVTNAFLKGSSTPSFMRMFNAPANGTGLGLFSYVQRDLDPARGDVGSHAEQAIFGLELLRDQLGSHARGPRMRQQISVDKQRRAGGCATATNQFVHLGSKGDEDVPPQRLDREIANEQTARARLVLRAEDVCRRAAIVDDHNRRDVGSLAGWMVRPEMRRSLHVGRLNQRRAAVLEEIDKHASGRITGVVVAARLVIDAVPAAPSRSPFKTNKLPD